MVRLSLNPYGLTYTLGLQGTGTPRANPRPRGVEGFIAIARDLGRTPAQVALRWVLDQPFITSAIVGARNSGQLTETMAAAGWRLPDEARARLDKVSSLPHRYPRSFEESMHERRNAAVRRPQARPS